MAIFRNTSNSLKACKFGVGQIAPFAGFESVVETELRDLHPLERQDHEMRGAAHVAYLALAPLLELEQQQVYIVFLPAEHLHGNRTGHVAVRHLDRPSQDIQLVLAPPPGGAHDIRLLVFVSRMGEPERKIAVVGKKNEPFGILVKPADGN